MLSVVIQAGGQSRRMGENKALKDFLGEPLILRIANRLKPLATEILVTTNQPELYSFLKVPLVQDVMPGKGALGGLLTAFQSAGQAYVAVVACDLPFVNPEIISYGLGLLSKDRAYDMVIPLSENGFEPLHAVYRRAECLEAVKVAITTGQMRVMAWIEQGKKRIITPQELSRFDPHGITFMNTNTPEDFRRAAAFARMYEKDCK